MDQPPAMDEPLISIVAIHERNYWSCTSSSADQTRGRGQFQIITGVALTTLLWDLAISLEDEIQYIWKCVPNQPYVLFLSRKLILFPGASRSPSMTNKWVYLISRYLGIISQLSVGLLISVPDVVLILSLCLGLIAPLFYCMDAILYQKRYVEHGCPSRTQPARFSLD